MYTHETLAGEGRLLHRAEFSSWSEFLAAAEADLPKGFQKKAGCSGSRGTGEMEFHGTADFKEARKLAREGWQDGRERIMAIRAGLDGLVAAAADAKSQSIAFDVEGEWLDVGRHLFGEPECFGGYINYGDAKSAKVIPVVINISCSASIGERVIFNRGAICLALVDFLETLGHRVELWVGASALCYDSGSGGGTHEWLALAKPASEPLDMDRLSFVMCHRSGLRRYGFSIYEHLGRAGSGTPQDFKRMVEGCAWGNQEGSSEYVYIPHLVSEDGLNTTSRERLVDHVIAYARKAGVTIERESVR